MFISLYNRKSGVVCKEKGHTHTPSSPTFERIFEYFMIELHNTTLRKRKSLRTYSWQCQVTHIFNERALSMELIPFLKKQKILHT